MAYTVITSRQNPTIKSVCALSEKKERVRSGLFRFDGIKLYEEAHKKGLEICQVFVCQDALDALQKRVGELLKEDASHLIVVSENVLDKLTEEKSPEGIVTVAKQPGLLHTVAYGEEEWRTEEESVCFLEAIRDPGNLGTMIRTASAMGIGTLILSEDCADLYHPRTVRAAMGALFCQRIVRMSGCALSEAIGGIRRSGRRVFATALRRDAVRLGEVMLRRGDCVVIGNEGHGLSEETVAACDACMLIPMREGNESLNAATAAAICMWELSMAGRSR